MDDRPDTRPEIEPYFWDITNLKWPVKGKTKPDLIIFDPPASPEGEADGGQVRLILNELPRRKRRGTKMSVLSFLSQQDSSTSSSRVAAGN
jgi:hypothetical protein